MMKPMSKRPRWTAEEEEYLAENWGTLAIPTLARNLGRSEDAVVIRARRLGLGPFLDSGDYVSFNQLLVAVTGGNSGYGYKIKSWVENRGFPLHYKRVGSQQWRIVYLKEYWKWAEKNRAFIDFSRMEPLALGEEPEWVAEQRREDFETFALQRKDPWTSRGGQPTDHAFEAAAVWLCGAVSNAPKKRRGHPAAVRGLGDQGEAGQGGHSWRPCHLDTRRL